MNSEQHNHQMVDRFVVARDDVGDLGVVGGGRLLGWLADAAEATAVLWSGRRCVLRSIGDFHLGRAISTGERVLLHTSLVYTRGSEMHVVVTVRTQRPDRPGDTRISQCSMVFAAVDGAGHDVAVRPWNPVTMLELQRHRQARLRSKMCARIERTMAAQSYTREGTTTHGESKVRAVTADGSAQGGVAVRRILRWIDDAVCASATEWSGDRALASYLAGLHFYRTIGIDDLVTVSVRIVHTGPRSMHVGLRVVAGESQRGLIARGLVVAVAPDVEGNALPVRPLRLRSAEDHRLDEHARQLIELRQFIEPGTTAMVIAENAQTTRVRHLNAPMLLPTQRVS